MIDRDGALILAAAILASHFEMNLHRAAHAALQIERELEVAAAEGVPASTFRAVDLECDDFFRAFFSGHRPP